MKSACKAKTNTRKLKSFFLKPTSAFLSFLPLKVDGLSVSKSAQVSEKSTPKIRHLSRWVWDMVFMERVIA